MLPSTPRVTVRDNETGKHIVVNRPQVDNRRCYDFRTGKEVAKKDVRRGGRGLKGPRGGAEMQDASTLPVQ